MKRFLFWQLIMLFGLTLVSCNDDENTYIEGLTMENYPVVDGSTSTDPLNRIIASKLLGYNYKWEQFWAGNGTWNISSDLPYEFIEDHIKASQTHHAILNLIDGNADIILSARSMSEDEKTYADAAGVKLIESPIALDAFIFLANPENPVRNLTTKQIQDIYTGKITNWNEVGGEDHAINPYVRNANSGSQELMESLVMKGVEIPEWPDEGPEMIAGMFPVFTILGNDPYGLAYTVFYYKERIVRRDDIVKSIAVDGVHPDKQTIKNRSYPYATEIYVCIREDERTTSMAYKLYQYLLSADARGAIEESGYFPIR